MAASSTSLKRKRAPTTVLYLIQEPIAVRDKTKSDLTDRLLRAYDPNPIGTWTLDHRLFRSTPRGDESDKEVRYQHLLQLNLEHRRGIDRAKVCFTGAPQGPAPGQNQNQTPTPAGDAAPTDVPGDDVTVSSIPTRDLSNYSHLLSTKLTALWTPRAALFVPNGSSFAVGTAAGAFVVRIGELRQRQGGIFRGVIVGIESSDTYDNATDDDATIRDAEADDVSEEEELEIGLIEGLWKTFGVEGARQKKGKGRTEDVVTWQWCSLLLR